MRRRIDLSWLPPLRQHRVQHRVAVRRARKVLRVHNWLLDWHGMWNWQALRQTGLVPLVNLIDAVTAHSDTFVVCELWNFHEVTRTILAYCWSTLSAMVLPLNERKCGFAYVTIWDFLSSPEWSLRNFERFHPDFIALNFIGFFSQDRHGDIQPQGFEDMSVLDVLHVYA